MVVDDDDCSGEFEIERRGGKEEGCERVVDLEGLECECERKKMVGGYQSG